MPEPVCFSQDLSARRRVLALRYWPGVLMLAVLTSVTFGWLASIESSTGLKILGLAVPLTVVPAAIVLTESALRGAKHLAGGSLCLTSQGVQVDASDGGSSGGFAPWSMIGGCVRVDDWQRRRAGVQTVAVLPRGATRWRRSRLAGDFGNALLVLAWLKRTDAAAIEAYLQGGMAGATRPAR
jgi:hypothetical protein